MANIWKLLLLEGLTKVLMRLKLRLTDDSSTERKTRKSTSKFLTHYQDCTFNFKEALWIATNPLKE